MEYLVAKYCLFQSSIQDVNSHFYYMPSEIAHHITKYFVNEFFKSREFIECMLNALGFEHVRIKSRLSGSLFKHINQTSKCRKELRIQGLTPLNRAAVYEICKIYGLLVMKDNNPKYRLEDYTCKYCFGTRNRYGNVYGDMYGEKCMKCHGSGHTKGFDRYDLVIQPVV